jgi:hypothetical protein
MVDKSLLPEQAAEKDRRSQGNLGSQEKVASPCPCLREMAVAFLVARKHDLSLDDNWMTFE